MARFALHARLLSALLCATACSHTQSPGTYEISMRSIGTIHTPYRNDAPYQPVHDAEGTFYLELDDEHRPGLEKLASFRYIYVLYAFHKLEGPPKHRVHPPWAPKGTEVGIFASRSPARPNPIGLSIVEVRRVEGSRVYTSGLDAFDGTPLLDIKPYVAELDVRTDANRGWVDDLPDDEHLDLHIRGIVHDHEERPSGVGDR